jgi:hypothetical protein
MKSTTCCTTRPLSLLALLSLALLLSPAAAVAGMVMDVADNDTIGTALNVDGGFNTEFNPNVHDAAGNNISTTAPHVSITRDGGAASYDYFQFTVHTGGTRGIFDVDSNGRSDTSLYLFDSLGTLLGTSQGHTVIDAGSTTLLDPFLQYTFAAAGLYVIGIAGPNSSAADGGITGQPVLPTHSYTINASLSAVPEPAAMLLFGTGAVGLLYSRRRKRSSAEGPDPAAAADAAV